MNMSINANVCVVVVISNQLHLLRGSMARKTSKTRSIRQNILVTLNRERERDRHMETWRKLKCKRSGFHFDTKPQRRAMYTRPYGE